MLGFCNLARVAVDLRDEVKASRYLVEAVRAGEGMYTILTTHAVLMGCAGLAALRGEWTFSLRLTGASEAHCDQHGLVYAATDGRSYARHKAGSQKALGDAAAATALAAGRALHIDTAFAEALAWLESVPTASTAAVAGSAASTVAT
jgi:hypothetical protein